MNKKMRLKIFAVFLVILLSGGLAFYLPPVFPQAASPPRPNIIFIVIDSLRRDHLSHFGYFRPTSPVIDRLFKQGVLFRQVISQSSQTAPSVSSFWTGLYPCHHGIQLYSYNQSYHPLKPEAAPYLEAEYKTLAEYLQDNGYITLAFVANPWLRTEFGFGQGFDLYLWLANANGQQIVEAFKNSLRETYLSATSKQGASKPFFAYLHFMDTHAPYISSSSPKNLFVQFKGEPVYGMGYKDYIRSDDLQYAMALYDEQIRRVDDFVGELINFLKELKFLEKTLLILAPDHGEEFYEHLGLGHGVTLYSEVTNIFFLFYLQNYFLPQEIDLQVQGVDLLPTLLDFLHISPVERKLDGQSFLPLILHPEKKSSFRKTRRLALSELGEKKALIQGKWKFIYNLFLKTEELYNLESDPHEIFNLADEEKSVRRELKNKLLFILDSAGKSTLSTSRLNEDLREKIRSLGYVGATDIKLSEGKEILSQPISDRIDFSFPRFNSLQLVYGWKDREVIEGNIFSQVGPFVKFVLKKAEKKRPSKLIIEGKNRVNLAPSGSLYLEIYMERKLLGRFWLKEKQDFTLTLDLPKKFPEERSVDFCLTWRKITEHGQGDKSALIQTSGHSADALLISKIYLQ